MKNLLVLALVICSTYSFCQSDFSINLLGNVDYSFSKYSYNEGQIDETMAFEKPLGMAINFELEYSVTPKLSVVSGIRYAHKIIHPRLLLPAAYGTALPKDDGFIYVFSPYLNKHEFHLIALPVSFKRYLDLGERISLYASIGMVVNFKFKEIETYKTAVWEEPGLQDQGVENHFPYTDNQFRLFSSAIDIGTGMKYKLGTKLALIIQTSASVLEFRKTNDKFKKNGDLLWEEHYLPIGQVSLGIGMQRLF